MQEPSHTRPPPSTSREKKALKEVTKENKEKKKKEKEKHETEKLKDKIAELEEDLMTWRLHGEEIEIGNTQLKNEMKPKDQLIKNLKVTIDQKDKLITRMESEKVKAQIKEGSKQMKEREREKKEEQKREKESKEMEKKVKELTDQNQKLQISMEEEIKKSKSMTTTCKSKDEKISELEKQLKEALDENKNLLSLEEYIKDLKEPPQQHEREIATLEEATNIIREHEKHAGILEKIKEGVAAKEKVIREKDEQLEKIKNKHEKLNKEQKETKKKQEGLEKTSQNQKKEITRLQRENGLLEEINRNTTTLNKVLEFPTAAASKKSNPDKPDNKSSKIKTYEKDQCKYGPSCKFLREKRCQYYHQETNEQINNQEINKCRNGEKCRYWKQNRCAYYHENTSHQREKCRNGLDCKYLESKTCRFQHTENIQDLEDENVQKYTSLINTDRRERCTNGAKCKYLKAKTCWYDHNEDTHDDEVEMTIIEKGCTTSTPKEARTKTINKDEKKLEDISAGQDFLHKSQWNETRKKNQTQQLPQSTYWDTWF